MRLIGFVVLLLISVFLSGLVFLEIMDFTFSNRTMYRSVPSDSVHKEYVSYRVDVIRQQRPLGVTYTLLIHRKEEPTYGYTLTYPESVVDPHQLIRKVLWEPRGVTLEFPDDATLFVPAKNFTGGR